MTTSLGPLDASGCVPAQQQTRVSAFLISAHGALARRLGLALLGPLRSAWQTELHAQLYRETEIVSLLAHATTWVPDLALPLQVLAWEQAWLPNPADGIDDWMEAVLIDLAALGHAIHGAIRPAALLPVEASAEDPFAMALRRIEFESGRLIQAQILFLKDARFTSVRDAVNAAVERRHLQVRELWTAMLDGL